MNRLKQPGTEAETEDNHLKCLKLLETEAETEDNHLKCHPEKVPVKADRLLEETVAASLVRTQFPEQPKQPLKT